MVSSRLEIAFLREVALFFWFCKCSGTKEMRAVHTIDILNLWNAMLKLRGISYRVLGDERLQVALRYLSQDD